MEQIPCRYCHVDVRVSDYYCYNCGKNLKPKPLSTSALSQLWIYFGSILLPPIGIVWGIRYLRQSDRASKIIGIIAIVLTVVVIVVTIQQALSLIDVITKQLGTQTPSFMGF